MKTREEVEALKSNWLGDPCWDIYDTDGFEEYTDELRVFQMNKSAKWQHERRMKLFALAEELGVPGNVQLAEKWQRLVQRIERLEAKFL